MARNSYRVAKVMFAQENNHKSLMELSNVVGTATGYRRANGKRTRQIAVIVYVRRKVPLDQLAPKERIPKRVAGEGLATVPTDVIEMDGVDLIQALDIARYRPVLGGVSVGMQARNNAGTLGGFACHRGTGYPVFLTANHVVTGVGDDFTTIPSPRGVVQPGRKDGGSAPDDLIGVVQDIVPIPTGFDHGVPYANMDAAVCSISTAFEAAVIDIAPAILEVAAASLLMDVVKRGRTTGLTNGIVEHVNVNVQFTNRYGYPLIEIRGAMYIESSDGVPFAIDGDSGALVFSKQLGVVRGTLPVVGLVFAKREGTNGAFATDISVIFDALELDTVGCWPMVKIIEVDHRTEARARYVREMTQRFMEELGRLPPAGPIIDFIRRDAPIVGLTMMQDEVAFGLAVRLLQPWLQHRTVLDILEASIDRETVQNLANLTRRVRETKALPPESRRRMARLATRVSEFESKPLMEFLEGVGPL